MNRRVADRTIGRALSVQAQQRSSSPRLASLREQLLQDLGEEKQPSWMDSVAVAEPVKSKRVQKEHVRHPDWLRVKRPAGRAVGRNMH